MVQKVDIPAEHYLLNFSGQLVGNFLKNTLIQFSIKKLLEAGIVSRTLKTGLDFTDGYKYPASRSKLNTFLWNSAIKEIPYITDGYVTNTAAGTDMGFMAKAQGSSNVTFFLYYDVSILRYVNILKRRIRETGVQIEFSIRQSAVNDTMEVTITQPRILDNMSYYKAYKALFYIEDFLKVIRTLSRKARFVDQNVKTATRSGRSLRSRGESTFNNRRAEILNQLSVKTT